MHISQNRWKKALNEIAIL
jgi:hypothetical protein